MSAKLEIQAGANMNLSPVLYSNIIQSPYFKFTLKEKVSFPAVLNEILNQVESIEPFLRENIASTAFCLLYKLHTLKLTVKQVTSMIGNKDSPYVRALAFLYLRYAGKPADLWEWYEPHLDDGQEFQLKKNSVITIGQFVRSLLTDQKFLGTMLPRIPVPIARSMEAKLNEKYPTSSGPSHKGNQKDHKQRSRSPSDWSAKDGSKMKERRYRSRSRSPDGRRGRNRSREYRHRHSSRSSSRERDYRRQMESSDHLKRRKSRSRSRQRSNRSRSRSRHRSNKSRSRSRHRSRSRSRHRRSRS